MSRFLPPNPAAFASHPCRGALEALASSALTALGSGAGGAGVDIGGYEYSAQTPLVGIEGSSAWGSNRVDIFQRERWRTGAPAYLGTFDAALGGTAQLPVVTCSSWRQVSPPPPWAGVQFTGNDDDNTTPGVAGSW